MHAGYDEDPVGTLARALARVLDADVSEWAELIELAGFDATRADALRRHEVGAMDALFRDLNELRGLDPYPPAR